MTWQMETSHGTNSALADDAAHVLVVDDDHRIRSLLERYLRENGYRTTAAKDVPDARASMRGLEFDLVVLDIMMPGESGLELARELKDQSDVPILMLTARASVDDRITGLEYGVDDYLAKPFEPRELVLRINNILRRRETDELLPDEVTMGQLIFHVARGELKRGPATIKLTERERDLLRLFAQRPGETIQRHELSGDDSIGNERAVDVQINRLRRKIEVDPSNPVYLQTVRGKGYILHTD
ncbi:MAG: response regulator transcription factor [Hyphomicrobiaceae bacterium]